MEVNPLDVIGYRQDQLDKIFHAAETGPAERMLNSGERKYDIRNKVVFNDTAWKGYFPVGHVLNVITSNIHASFKKRFFKESSAIKGVTSDSDFFVHANNTIGEVTLAAHRGSLRPGKYVLLRYTDLQWRAFYDLLRVINKNLIIGKVFMGLPYPDGTEVFTFSMVREYSFDEMTVEDHRELYERLAVAPDPASLQGAWNMTVVANSNHRSDVAQLNFDLKPDGRVEARYALLRILQGESQAEMQHDQLVMHDFTPLRDEIRAIDGNYMLGKWVTEQRLPFGPFSLGLLQAEPSGAGQSQFGFYYTLRRATAFRPLTSVFMDKILNRKLCVGLNFKEQMDGSYYAGDADRSPAHVLSLDPSKGRGCQFNVTMTIPDLDVFVSSDDHRAELSGTIQFEEFRGDRNAVLPLEAGSFFNYLILNPATGEHEMRYHIRFNHRGILLALCGTKYMQKDHKQDLREILLDYTTLFAQVSEVSSGTVQGVALMKFRTFESNAALGSMAQFVSSFTVTGTDDPVTQAAAIAKFNAFTTRFVFDEYNPLGP